MTDAYTLPGCRVWHQTHIGGLVVEVVIRRHLAGGTSQGGVCGDVRDACTIQPDLTAVFEAVEVLCTGTGHGVPLPCYAFSSVQRRAMPSSVLESYGWAPHLSIIKHSTR